MSLTFLGLSACGGTATGNPDASSMAVSVQPSQADVVPTGTQTFIASVTGTSASAVTWSISEGSAGGAITSGGVYTAPSQPGTFHVVATASADPTVTATAVVTVTSSPSGVAVSVSPHTQSVATGRSITFGASVTGTSNTAVAWSVSEGAGGGSITSSGVYTAPAQPGTYHVVATSAADSSKSDTATVTVTAPVNAGDLSSQFAVLAGKAIFFDHASVGGDLMDGVSTLLATVSGSKPRIINMNISNGGLKPDLITTGVWAESGKLYYHNEFPFPKVAQFQTDLAAGVGAKVNIAFMKFCFVDFNNSLDVDALFATYQKMITEVKASYPNVRFVHITAPLESPDNGAYNVVRERFSAKLRAAYGSEVFDLALHESTRPDGTRETVNGVPALVPAYTNDSGHLNPTGRAQVVPQFVKFLANL